MRHGLSTALVAFKHRQAFWRVPLKLGRLDVIEEGLWILEGHRLEGHTEQLAHRRGVGELRRARRLEEGLQQAQLAVGDCQLNSRVDLVAFPYRATKANRAAALEQQLHQARLVGMLDREM